jgi:WD40 repeat protein
MSRTRFFCLFGLVGAFNIIIGMNSVSSLKELSIECIYHNNIPPVRLPAELNMDSHLGYLHSLKHPVQFWRLLSEGIALNLSNPDNPADKKPAHQGSITGSSFFKDNKKALTVGADGRLCVWNIEDGSLEAEIQAHADYIKSMAMSLDETLVLTCSDDMSAKLWRIDTLELMREFKHSCKVTCGAISLSKNLVATGSNDGKIRIFTLEYGESVHDYEHFMETERAAFMYVHSIKFINNDSEIIGIADRVVKIWQRDTGDLAVKGSRELGLFPCSALITPHGKVFCGTALGVIEAIEEPGPPKKKRRIMEQTGVNALACSGDGRFLAVGTSGRKVHTDLWISPVPFCFDELVSLECIQEFGGHEMGIKTIAFSSDGAMLLTGGMDGNLKLWTFQRLAKEIGLAGARLIASLNDRADDSSGVDLRLFPELAALYSSLNEEVRNRLDDRYRILI